MARLNDRTGKNEEVPRPTVPPEFKRVDVEGIIQEKERYWSGKLQKPQKTPDVPESGQGYTGTDPFSVEYPALVAFLRDVTYADGSRRTPGSVVMFIQDGMFTVCLCDKGQPPMNAFQAARSPSEAFSLAETGLRSGSLSWRSPAKGRGQR